MRNTIASLAAALGILFFAGNASGQTDTTKTEKIPVKTENIRLRSDEWGRRIDVGLGFRNHGIAYLGFTGVNNAEDTTNLPSQMKPTYGIGARVVFGRPHPSTGGLTSIGLCGGYETYFNIRGREVPLRFLAGGAFYNPEDLEAGIETRALGIVETTLPIGRYDFNFGVHLQKGNGLNALVGARF